MRGIKTVRSRCRSERYYSDRLLYSEAADFHYAIVVRGLRVLMSNARDFCTRGLSLLIILTTGAFVGLPVVRQASATHDPTDFTIMALFSGWNSTLPPGSFTACSPTGTSSCNPSFREFRGVAFTVSVVWKDNQHNVAIYTRNFAGTVNTLNACSLSNTNGCLAKSVFVTSTSTTTLLTFTPTVPLDDFTGDGGYEYYCQLHPSTMHGKITVSKSPDLDKDGAVTIVDIATAAAAFGSIATPPSANWNIAADIDNDGDVDIVDIATAAAYFGKTLVD